jgi:hypothetical protein
MTTTEHASIISSRPSWAETTEIALDSRRTTSFTHRWTAPTVAEAASGSDGDVTPITVELEQTEDIYVNDAGVVLDPGPGARIFLSDLDTWFVNVTEARRFAAAIVEACDRWDGSR